MTITRKADGALSIKRVGAARRRTFRDRMDQERREDRLDAMVGRVAAGWYGVALPLDGENFGENPRAIDGGIPGSVTRSIVQHAAALVREVDAYLAAPKKWTREFDSSNATPFLIASTGPAKE